MSADEDEGLDGVGVPDKMFFRIGEVAQIVGVEPHVLRYWESEFRLRPTRSESGQRMYRRRDVARFVRIRRLLHDEGFTIAGARKALTGGGKGEESVDAARVRDALARIEELRDRVADLRGRLGALGSGAS